MIYIFRYAAMAELADAIGLGPIELSLCRFKSC